MQVVDAGSRIEVMARTAEGAGKAGIDEAGLAAVPGIAAVVAGGGEVSDALGFHLVDGLGDDAVLEHRLGEVDDVVDDHLRAGLVGQLDDAVGEVGLAAEGGVEGLTGPRRDVADQLHHGAALVGAGTSAVVEDRDLASRRQVAGRDVAGRAAQAVIAVGQGADGDPATLGPEGEAGDVGEHRRVTFAGHGAGAGQAGGRAGELQAAELGGLLERADRQPA